MTVSPVQAALEGMDAESWRMYLRSLRKADARSRLDARGKGARRGLRSYEQDHPGHPLGRGYPLGRSLREDGESHHEAWARILRSDPCAYCGAKESGTVDHVEPRSRTVTGIGGAYCWMNLIGSCQRCNGSKGSKSLLLWLHERGPRAFAQ